VDKELKKEIGKYFVDVSKLLIGGVVLSSVLKIQGLSNVIVIIVGASVAVVLAIFGFALMRNKSKPQ